MWSYEDGHAVVAVSCRQFAHAGRAWQQMEAAPAGRAWQHMQAELWQQMEAAPAYTKILSPCLLVACE